MANPRVSEGYTRIANELLEAMCKYISNPSFLRVSLIIIRLTYGWGRKEALINLKSLATKLTLTVEYVRAIIVEMELAEMIKADFKKPYQAVITFNKDYEEWTFVKR